MTLKLIYTYILLLLLAVAVPMDIAAGDKFVVVIDAGHGGTDPGAIAANKRLKEKDINLAIALKLGKKIQQKHPDTKVIYTRSKDVFVKLNDRAKIANKAKADLFISIHTNAAENRSANGTETYVFGLEQTGINMEVAKRENAVIYLEEDYSTTYQGYDPNSVESYIMINIQQNKYFEQSIHFASLVQEQFRTLARRPDRSVRQQNLLVLRLTSMPSILVEVGYISNSSDAAYLAKDASREKLAESIYRAFVTYKEEWDRKTQTGYEQSAKAEKSATKASKSEVVYKIQLMASKQKLSEKDATFKGLSPISYYKENGWYKYTYGEATRREKLAAELPAVKKKFKDAFIVAFKNGEKIK